MGKNAVLFVNLLKKNSSFAADEIRCELEKRGFKVVVFSFEGEGEKPPEGKWDIAFSIGGDGTVLYTARCIAPLGVPILPVNMGTLGFIAGVSRDKWLDVFLALEKGEITPSRHCMLEITVERNSKTAFKSVCLNDIVISSSGIAKLINLNVNIDENSLGDYRCDGLIIATPTGSTAYSMAAGGPILDPEMDGVIINPICPFALSIRPYVIPSQHVVSIAVAAEQRSAVLLTVDGQETFDLECKDRVIIRQSQAPALLVFADRHVYYSALKNKLFWSGVGSDA